MRLCAWRAARHESELLTRFSELGLAEPILRAVGAQGYSTPTPIQSAAIPVLLAGRDMIGIAQTGTGKTAAFVLPLLHKLAANRARPGRGQTHALVLAPTRELAAQIADAVRAYGRHLRLSATVITGGARHGPQIKALASGVDIVIATPGRLEDHMSTGALRLDKTHNVILDEADQMLDLGFMPAIRRIMAKLPAQRQTVLLSATMPEPIRELSRAFLRNAEEIAVSATARPVDSIEQRVLTVESAAKRGVLIDLLNDPAMERTLVFTRTKRGADKVCRHLAQAGLAASAIHGNKSQGQRTKALAAFRNGRVAVLVATDIAARGIDIDDVSHVINYELPNVPEAYVHRIGRTARAGKTGIAISLCDPSERGFVRDIERLTQRTLLPREDRTDGVEADTPPAGDRRRKRKTRATSKNPNRSRAAGQKDPAGQKGPARQKGNPKRKGSKAAALSNRGTASLRRPDGPTSGLARMLGA